MQKLHKSIRWPVLALFFAVLSSFASSSSYLSPDNPDFPSPPESNSLLFYIQRNMNSNTIVYEANIVDGALNKKDPMKVYWLKYDRGDPNGTYKEINYIESILAYGVKVKPSKEKEGHFDMNLVSYNKRHFDIYMDEDGHARAEFPINGKQAIIQKIFAQAVETAWYPKVEFVELFGIDPITREAVYEKIYP